MSDQTQPSALDLFKFPASPSTPGLKSFDGMGADRATERTFSRELSRATDQAAPSREKHSRTGNDKLDRFEQKPTLRSESSRHPDRAESGKSDKSVKNSTTTTDENAKVDSDASPVAPDKVEEPSSGRLANSETTNKQAISDSENLEDKALTHSGPEITVPGEDTPGKDQVLPVGEYTEVSTTDSSKQKPALEDLPVAVPAGTDVIKGTGTAEFPGSTASDVANLMPDVANASSKGSETLDSGAGVEKNQTQRLIAGEQLSPRQLANRQAHLFNQTSNLVPVTQGVPQPVKVESVDTNIDDVTSRSATIAATVAAPSVGVTKDGRMRALSADQSNLIDASVKTASMQSMAGDSTEQIVARRMLAADAEAATNMAANVAAKQAEQQVLQGNLAQVRQLAQQQIQNMNMATVPVTPESVDRPSQPVDNTFLSLPGGIVTAPVVQRPDAGMNQAINAPINMPILQNDADKAMAGNIRWMVNEGVKNAVVNVKPSGMGPISVTIGIEKDQMNISIVALQGSTREALDSMLPRLREQLAAQGHDSVKVDISDGRADQTDRGYGQQFAGEKNSADQNNLLFGTQSADGESDDGSEPAAENSDSAKQGLININESGQIRSRYDVYV